MSPATRDQLRAFARGVLDALDRGRLHGPATMKIKAWILDHVPPAKTSASPAAGVRATDPDTARDAARTVDATAKERQVLDALRLCPAGATTHHLAQMTGLRLESVAPRMAPLVRAGRVRDSGERRQTTPGHSGIVWVAVAQAVSA